jgi:hypothetical protein
MKYDGIRGNAHVFVMNGPAHHGYTLSTDAKVPAPLEK